MFRSTIIAFVAGWALWFWIDKSPPSIGPLPQPLDGEFRANFQIAADLLKAGRYSAAFVYVWQAHYLALSLGAGLLIGALAASLSRALSRRRLRKLYVPARHAASDSADKAEENKSGRSGPNAG